MMNNNEQFLYTILMNGIKDMVFVMELQDGQFIYRFLNKSAMELAELEESVIGKSLEAILPSEKAAFLMEKYQQVVETKRELAFIDSFPSNRDLKSRYGKNLLTPLLDDKGNCKQIVAIVQDATDKMEAEKRVKESKTLLEANKQRYQSLFDYNMDAIVVLDLSGKIIAGNHASDIMTGYTSDELACTDITDLVTADDQEMIKGNFLLALKGVLKEYRMTLKHKQGNLIELIVKFTPIIVKNEVVGVYVIGKDITKEVIFRNKYTQSKSKFKIIAEHTHDMISMVDDKGMVTYVSPSCMDILNYPQKEYVGKRFTHNVHPDDIDVLNHSFNTSKLTGDPWLQQYRQKNSNNLWVWSELRGSPVFDETGMFEQMVVISRDISIRKDYEEKLQYFAYHDSLTGLPNRRYLNEQFDIIQKENEGILNQIAIMIIDLDEFKSINDTFGHDAGDAVIKELGARITKVIRGNDLAVRLGGDEFVVLIQHVESEQMVMQMAERITSTLQMPWYINGHVLNQTASVGAAIAAIGSNCKDVLIKNADMALYEVKNTGGNGFSLVNLITE